MAADDVTGGAELTKGPIGVVTLDVMMTSVKTSPVRQRGPARRYALAGLEVVVALSALAGGLALAVGSIDMGDEIHRRLPFASPVVGGLALMIVVGLPMTVAALASVRGSSNVRRSATTAGAALVIWILVEILVLRSFSLLQPTFLIVGVVVTLAGLRG